ncbi:kinase-like domain-containing protein [Desarmillaria tabescens]|uniref:Kinase-like domain-containing protein n=1 Tax=Armillaria tabescens TaxID=1929756 RepID=A0AA39NHR5_ARMTA|nr:kinase-like domain-containing protein [Desarmillaria tabescens]KAK0465880.1 kinase-like domain-containing protein [Desarmillaria tabescens]
MTLFKDYLEQKAKFYSPDPVGSAGEIAIDVTPFEVALLSEDWKPVAGWRDRDMVDALLSALDRYLQDRPLPVLEEQLDFAFQPMRDRYGSDTAWRQNTNETQARRMVYHGAISALNDVMEALDLAVNILEDLPPPNTAFHSKVDYAIYRGRRKICVDVKSWSVMIDALSMLERPSFHIELVPGRDSAKKIINNACLYMASHKANWLALTCHHKWIFLRLHNRPANGTQGPYITYSSVEEQPNNTKPFRALLAMMLAAEEGLEIESKADLSVPLLSIEEEDKEDSNKPQVDPDENTSGAYHRWGKAPRQRLLRTQSNKDSENQPNQSADIMISWTQRQAPVTKWFSFSSVDKSGPYLSLGQGPVQLRLQRLLGHGSTGVVYEAKRDASGNDETTDSQSYALKVVRKGEREEEEGALKRMYNESSAYRVIEQARKNGKIGAVVPRCYGLFESQHMLLLVLDCEGMALDPQDWTSMAQRDKVQIFNMISALHRIGIEHCDLEPRNIVRTADGSYKIIDLSSSSFHDCPGIKELPWYTRGGEQCYELKYMYKELIGKRPLHVHGVTDVY